MSKLLIEEPPLQVLPSLALKIGLNEAIVLQQLHYLLRNPQFGGRIAEHQWIFNTYEQWRAQYFPFWSEDTIKRAFTNLAKLKLIVTCQPEGAMSRRKYYRIDREKLDSISEQGKLPSSSGQIALTNGAKRPVPITKTTAKTSSQRKVKGAFVKAPSKFSPRYAYPETEEEMIETLEAHEIEYNPDYDGQFFDTMTKCGWTIRGLPVYDWLATYEARLQVTSPANIF